MKWPFCQFENEDGALFCEQCKSDLGVIEAVAAPPASEPHLVSAAPVEAIPLVAAPEASPALAAVVGEAAPATERVATAQVAAESAVAADAVIAVPVTESDTIPLTPGAEVTPPSPVGAAAVPSAPPPAERLPPGTKPKLVVQRGQRVGTEYPIYEGDNYIGRTDEKAVDIDLEDQEPPDRVWSSRQHALLNFADGQLTLEDLNSTNGTFVNRIRVHPGQKCSLRVNDVIQIGTVRLQVSI